MEPSGTKSSFSSMRDPKKQAKKSPRKKTSASSPRIKSLAMPRYHGKKYEKPVQLPQSGVSPKALTASASARIEEMSIPPLRTLVMNKQIYSRLPTTGPVYEDRLDRMIERSWNSMYNCYKKARTDVGEQKEEAGRKTSRASSLDKHSTRTFKDKDTRRTRDGRMVW